jgi:hypothetical protein
VPQPPLDRGPDHGRAHRLAHDEARQHGGVSRRRGVGGDCQMRDERGPSGPSAAAHGSAEVRRPPHAVRGGEHGGSERCELRLRPTARYGPWHGGWPGSRARHGSACADGSRGSWHDGGCSAGRCACSLGAPLVVGALQGAASLLGMELSGSPRQTYARRRAASAIDFSTCLRYVAPPGRVKPEVGPAVAAALTAIIHRTTVLVDNRAQPLPSANRPALVGRGILSGPPTPDRHRTSENDRYDDRRDRARVLSTAVHSFCVRPVESLWENVTRSRPAAA